MRPSHSDFCNGYNAEVRLGAREGVRNMHPSAPAAAEASFFCMRALRRSVALRSCKAAEATSGAPDAAFQAFDVCTGLASRQPFSDWLPEDTERLKRQDGRQVQVPSSAFFELCFCLYLSGTEKTQRQQNNKGSTEQDNMRTRFICRG